MIARLRKELDRAKARRAVAVACVRKERAALTECDEELSACVQAQSILQAAAQRLQHKAHVQIAKVVSRCLTAVFDRPYELRILFERKRGKTEARFLYYRDGRACDPGVTSGGVREVASLALRLVSVVLGQPPRRRLLVLDEPFRGVSVTNLKKVGALIESLSKELNVQFIIVSHNPLLQIGKVIQL